MSDKTLIRIYGVLEFVAVLGMAYMLYIGNHWLFMLNSMVYVCCKLGRIEIRLKGLPSSEQIARAILEVPIRRGKL